MRDSTVHNECDSSLAPMTIVSVVLFYFFSKKKPREALNLSRGFSGVYLAIMSYLRMMRLISLGVGKYTMLPS